ncbi:hypothetical protein pb186bvf_014255 [Paramecium bursaria]
MIGHSLTLTPTHFYLLHHFRSISLKQALLKMNDYHSKFILCFIH